MKILITGGAGFIASNFVRYMANKYPEYQIVNLDLLTYAGNLENLKDIEGYPNYRFVKGDICVNAIGTRNVAVASEKIQAKLVYISTDYVFDGKKGAPYTEFDSPNPLGVYGQSKLAGEEFVNNLSSHYFIIRTSWVFGKHGDNFVKTMLKLAKEREELFVVNDQLGSPTYTADLAVFIKELVETELYGIYHASNSGACSWYDFATAIFEEIGLHVKVSPCSTKDFPRPAPRPAYSVMDHMAIRLNHFQDFRDWREGLRAFLKDEIIP